MLSTSHLLQNLLILSSMPVRPKTKPPAYSKSKTVMPANLLTDMNQPGGLEEQRALQIALEISKLGLGENGDNSPATSLPTGPPPPPPPPQQAYANGSVSETSLGMSRKSVNMTECVPVPSSEHVAEIVGRQGCKIKALRAKTNTYIKTPVRGEEPVFVVTGRKEDVCSAKREILSAAEHFSQIRASRRNNNTTGGVGTLPGPPNPTTPGQVTIQVRVPYRVVGLVVGPKGATIKRIQQQTHTYIVTPNRDKEPIFEVTGLPENVEKARQEIESHIATRTGGILDSNINMINGLSNNAVLSNLSGMITNGNISRQDDNDFHSNGVDTGFHDINTDLLSSLYKLPSSNSAFTQYTSAVNQSNNLLSQQQQQQQPPQQQQTQQQQQQQQPQHPHPAQHAAHQPQEDSNIFSFPPLNGVSNKLSDIGLSNGFNGSTTTSSFGLYDSDEGIGGSPSFDPNGMAPVAGTNPTSIWSTDPDSVPPPNTAMPTYSSIFTAVSTPHAPRRSNSFNMSSASSTSTAPSLSPPLSTSDPSNEHPPPHTSHAHPPPPPAVTAAVTLATDHSSVRRLLSDPLSNGLIAAFSPMPHPGGAAVCGAVKSSMASLPSSTSVSPTDSVGSLGARRQCMICMENNVVAALVPCGHNLFCMECANLITQKTEGDRRCPVCQQPPTQAIRIFS